MTDDAKLSREAIELSVAQLPDQPFAFDPPSDIDSPDDAIEEAVSDPLGSLDQIEETVDDGLDETSISSETLREPVSAFGANTADLPVLTDTVATATHLLVKEASPPRNTEEIPVLKDDAPQKSVAQSGVDADMLAEIEGFMAELEADGTLAPVTVTVTAAATPPPAPAATVPPAPVAPAVVAAAVVETEQHGPATEDDFLPEPEPTADTLIEQAIHAAALQSEQVAATTPEPELDTNIEPIFMEMPEIDTDDLAPFPAPATPPSAPREATHTVAFAGNEASAFSLNIPFELHAQLSRKIDQLVVEAATSITNELQTQLSERVELLLQQAVETALPALIDNMVQSLRSEVRGRIRQQLPLIVNDVLGKTRLSDGSGH